MLGSAVFGAAVVMALLRGEQRLGAKGYTLVLGIGLAASAWAFRWALFMGVQGVPKFGAGLYLYSMPLGGEGLMGMLGVAGLCVALVAMTTWALELFPPANLLLALEDSSQIGLYRNTGKRQQLSKP